MDDTSHIFDPGDDITRDVAAYVATLDQDEALMILGGTIHNIRRWALDPVAVDNPDAFVASVAFASGVAMALVQHLAQDLGIDREQAARNKASVVGFETFLNGVRDEVNARIRAHLEGQ